MRFADYLIEGRRCEPRTATREGVQPLSVLIHLAKDAVRSIVNRPAHGERYARCSVESLT
jgi:hypothetical protein